MCHWEKQTDGEGTTDHLAFVVEETVEDSDSDFVVFS